MPRSDDNKTMKVKILKDSLDELSRQKRSYRTQHLSTGRIAKVIEIDGADGLQVTDSA